MVASLPALYLLNISEICDIFGYAAHVDWSFEVVE